MALWDKFMNAASDLLRRITGGASGDDATRRVTFTIAVIALSAKMAKADGRVSETEVDAFREIFKVPPQEFKNVARVYDLAKQDTAGYESYAKQVANLFKDNCVILEDLLEALFHIAKADGHVHEDEMSFLKRVADIFGFTEAGFERVAHRHVGADRSSPFTILGVAPDADAEEIKQVYRRLVRENHPDRLIAQGLPREFVAVANDRLAAINDAYSRIAEQRRLAKG